MNPIPCVAVIGALTIFAVEACCAETTTNTAGLLEGFRKKSQTCPDSPWPS